MTIKASFLSCHNIYIYIYIYRERERVISDTNGLPFFIPSEMSLAYFCPRRQFLYLHPSNSSILQGIILYTRELEVIDSLSEQQFPANLG